MIRMVGNHSEEPGNMTRRPKHPLTAQARNVIGRYGWLSLQSEALQEAFFEVGDLRTVEAGHTLYTIGDTEGSLHALISGWQDILVSPWTETPTLMHVCGPSSWVGGLRVASKAPRRVSVVTRTRCEVAFFREPDLMSIGAKNPDLFPALSLMSTLYCDLLISIVAAQAERKAYNRVCLTLLRMLGEGHPEAGLNLPDPVTIPVGHAEISEMSLMTRNVVGPILKQLEDVGAIKQGYKSIQVLDRRLLRKLD